MKDKSQTKRNKTVMLKKEIVRVLSDRELTQVAGGADHLEDVVRQMPEISNLRMGGIPFCVQL